MEQVVPNIAHKTFNSSLVLKAKRPKGLDTLIVMVQGPIKVFVQINDLHGILVI